MVEINKTIPNELDGDSKYSVRIRSINSFGVSSDWSEALVIDTGSAGLASAGRLIITSDSITGYTETGALAFSYSAYGDDRTNLVKNPSFEETANGWVALPSSSLSRSTVTSFFSQPGYGASARIISLVNSTVGVGMEQSASHRIPVNPNDILTVSAYAKISSSNGFRIGFRFYSGGGALLSEVLSLKDQNVSTSLWTRLSAVGLKAPAGAASAAVVIKSVKPMSTTNFYYIDGVLVENGGVLREYFDGSTSAGSTSWTGTANDSTSEFLINAPFYNNGAVITESVIQTNPNVDIVGGVKIDPLGFYAYSPSGDQKVYISALTGDITAKDGVFTGSTFQTALGVGTGVTNAIQGVIFNNLGIKGYSGVGLIPSFELNTSGSMTARSGTIGGWSITSSTLQNANVSLNSNGNIIAGTGNNIAQISGSDATNRVWVGHATPTLAPFRVTQTGALFATGATITGSISATSGTIGGWTVGASTLVGGNMTLSNTGDITAGTGNNVVRISASDATYRLWVGNAAGASAPFSVTNAGAITSTAGTIGGITISSSQLSVGTGSNIAAMRAGVSAGDVVFYAGSATPSTAPFRVTNSGFLYATQGYIGSTTQGWQITSNALTSVGGTLGRIGLDSGVNNNPKIYIMLNNATPNTPAWGTPRTSFYADSLGLFSLRDKLLFDPGNTETGGLGTLTIIGRVRGAIENYPVFQLDKGKKIPTTAIVTSNVATLTFGSPHGFITGDTIVNEDFSGIYTVLNGAWRIESVPNNTTLTFSITNPNLSSGAPGATPNTRVRELTLGLHPQMTSPDGGIISPAGLGLRLDENNYWFLNNHFRVGSAYNYIKWDGYTFTVAGYVPSGGSASDINNNITTINGGMITTGTITGNSIAANNNITVGTGTYKIKLIGSSGTSTWMGITSQATPVYNSQNTPFYAGADTRVSIGDRLTFDGTDLAVTGLINATNGGNIGGWTVNDVELIGGQNGPEWFWQGGPNSTIIHAGDDQPATPYGGYQSSIQMYRLLNNGNSGSIYMLANSSEKDFATPSIDKPYMSFAFGLGMNLATPVRYHSAGIYTAYDAATPSITFGMNQNGGNYSYNTVGNIYMDSNSKFSLGQSFVHDGTNLTVAGGLTAKTFTMVNGAGTQIAKFDVNSGYLPLGTYELTLGAASSSSNRGLFWGGTMMGLAAQDLSGMFGMLGSRVQLSTDSAEPYIDIGIEGVDVSNESAYIRIGQAGSFDPSIDISADGTLILSGADGITVNSVSAPTITVGGWLANVTYPAVESAGGYVLLGRTVNDSLYFRSKGTGNINLGVNGANDVVLTDTTVIIQNATTVNAPFTSTTLEATSAVSGAVQTAGQFYTTANGTSSYSTAPVRLGNGDGTVINLGFHITSVAHQLRAVNDGTMHHRNSGDTGYYQFWSDVVDTSSKHLKQDIESWGAKRKSLSAGTPDTLPSALDIVDKLRPVTYRWIKEDRLDSLPHDSRRAAALDRLNTIRRNRGEKPFQSEETVHLCGRDCDGQPDAPCGRYLDWEKGKIGVIAQEVGEVVPQAAVINPATGEYEGIDPTALATLSIKAIQELNEEIKKEIAELRAEIAELRNPKSKK